MDNFALIRQLFSLIPNTKKYKLFLLIILIFSVSLIEMASIAIVFPFLTALTNPDGFLQNSKYQLLLNSLNISTSNQLIIVISLIFIFFVILSGLTRLYLLNYNTKISFQIGSDLNTKIFKLIILQNYNSHLMQSSSDIIDLISNKTNIIIYGVLLSSINLCSSIVMLIFIINILIYIDPFLSLSFFISISFIYYFIMKIIKNKLYFQSETVSSQSKFLVKHTQESLNSIKHIILNNFFNIFIDKFNNSDFLLRKAQSNIAFYTMAPKYLLEMFGMLLIAILILTLTINDEIGSAIPKIGIIILSAQRLLPIMQQIYSCWANINSSRTALIEYLEICKKRNNCIEFDKINQNTISFKNEIKIENLSFSYESNKVILKDINFIIKKGDRVGITGRTGEGKSTLLDILMGLLQPKESAISVDGIKIDNLNIKNYRSMISFVPQKIYLLDKTISENIAFGIEPEMIDLDRVKFAAKSAQIDDFITSLPEKYQTIIGEDGIKLSGGQRQRIGIARALYKNSEIIVLDEATSSLDIATEELVSDSLNNLDNNITLIIVAHKTSTLNKCNLLLNLNNKSVSINRKY